MCMLSEREMILESYRIIFISGGVYIMLKVSTGMPL